MTYGGIHVKIPIRKGVKVHLKRGIKHLSKELLNAGKVLTTNHPTQRLGTFGIIGNIVVE